MVPCHTCFYFAHSWSDVCAGGFLLLCTQMKWCLCRWVSSTLHTDEVMFVQVSFFYFAHRWSDVCAGGFLPLCTQMKWCLCRWVSSTLHTDEVMFVQVGFWWVFAVPGDNTPAASWHETVSLWSTLIHTGRHTCHISCTVGFWMYVVDLQGIHPRSKITSLSQDVTKADPTVSSILDLFMLFQQ